MSVDRRTELDGRYLLDRLVGSGGMADVYRATDQLLRRTVAVKVMRDVGASEADRMRFAAEARTLAQLNHPGLVTILDAGAAADQPYLVMELVDGPTLAAVCAGAPLDPGRVADVGAQIADALAYAHDAGVVHRDVKPANILLGADGRAQLGDFGIARLMEDAARHTRTGLVVGTASYLAPEQLRGDDVTAAADIYALGLVLIEAGTGAPAYPGAGIEAAMARLSRPPTVSDRLPADWQRLLRAMTAMDPAERPSAAEVSSTLRGIVSTDQTTHPLPVPGPSETRVLTTPVAASTSPSRPAWIAAVVLVIAVVVAGAVVAVANMGGGGEAAHRVEMPTDVPPRLEQPLRDLHDALNGESP